MYKNITEYTSQYQNFVQNRNYDTQISLAFNFGKRKIIPLVLQYVSRFINLNHSEYTVLSLYQIVNEGLFFLNSRMWVKECD